MASELTAESVLSETNQVKPSMEFLQEVQSWSVGQRIEFFSQLLIHETSKISKVGFFSIEIKVQCGKLSDFKMITNYKTSDLNELR